jgi:LPS export ABC transporter protein LptC
MIEMIRICGIFALITIWISCSDNNIPQPRLSPEELEKERVEDVEMIYSDSAIVQFKIKSALLQKYDDDGVSVEEFTNGFEIQFFDDQQRVKSQLNSKYAIRRSQEGLLILRDSVTFINENQDRLETNALTIDEVNDIIYTKKVFRLIKSVTLDTIYGIGFTAKSDFSKLQITKYQGKRQGIDISS